MVPVPLFSGLNLHQTADETDFHKMTEMCVDQQLKLIHSEQISGNAFSSRLFSGLRSYCRANLNFDDARAALQEVM